MSPAPSHKARQRARLRRSLADYTRWAWPLITGREYVPNEISERIIGTLQRVGDGELTRVLIACPPGVGKSTSLACYSSWRLARDPGHRSIHGSHAAALAETESRRVRRLIEGDEFKRVFPGVVLREDESTASHWATSDDGRYYAIGVGGALTGRRGHEAVIDDALNAVDRFSKAARDACYAWFQEALATRLDGDRAPIIVVMQRLDRDDLIGRLIAAGGWTLVECPAEDEHGEPLAPNVLPREKLDAIKATIGAAAYACQFGQRPSDDANASIKRSWWRFHHGPSVAPSTPRPSGCDTTIAAVATPTTFDKIVIACDLTFGGLSTKNDLACCSAWGRYKGSKFLLGLWWKRGTQLAQRDAIKALKAEYPSAKIVIEKAAAGAGVLELLAKDGIPAIGIVPVGSKAERLDVVSPAIESGGCNLPLGTAWLGAYVEELAGATAHDDASDSTAIALSELATGSTDWSGFAAVMARVETAQPHDAPSTPGESPFSFGRAAQMFSAKPAESKPEPTAAERSRAHWALRDQDPSFRAATAPPPSTCPHSWIRHPGESGPTCTKCGAKG